MVGNWIIDDNLMPFLETCAGFVGYPFDDADRTALKFGVKETQNSRDAWYEYAFYGAKTIELWLRLEAGSFVLSVRVESEPEVEAKIALVMEIMQEYWLFGDDPRPRS